MSLESVDFRLRDGTPLLDARVQNSWPGFSVECVQLNQARAFDYDWEGDSHYLAVHDILLRDGEAAIGDGQTQHRTDLRNLMTFVPRQARVSGWSELNNNTASYTAIFFNPALAENECEQPLLGASTRPLLYFEDARLCHTMRRLEKVVSACADPDPVATETLGLLAILQLFPIMGGAIRKRAGYLSLSQQRDIAEFIDSGIASAISLSDMAAVAGLSRYHFARSFTRTFGRAPHRYLLLRRISTAASFLSSGNMSVSEIAQRVGFSSTARLSIAFGKIMGVSPRTFRRAVRF